LEQIASMQNTDKSLIDAHLRGDRTAFGELVSRYGDSLLGYLTRICGDHEQAEDLFQETFRRVHEKAHTLRGRQFKSWLYTIATRVAIDGFRRRTRRHAISLNQRLDCDGENCEELGAVAVVESCHDPSEEVVRAEQKEQVRQALDSLPARQRATLVLAYYQGLTYREVADVMGCSMGAVKTHMYRALKTLAGRLPHVSGVDI
jgi:RNA polymerase sigma-70 factor (ECF subfamily)